MPRLGGFRRDGRAAIDWVARYLERLESFPVRSPIAPGGVRERLPASPPERGEEFEAILSDLDEIVLPGITHWQAPSFFGFFPANSSPPAILGELLSAGLGVQGMQWATSPACTELESHVLDWLVDMLDLPARFRSDGAGGGVIQDTASSATLCALLAARERATGGESNAKGVRTPLVAYCSAEAHSSVQKAVRIAGLGDRWLRRIEVDADLRMRTDALRDAVEADRATGAQPCFVCATCGTTSTGAVDDIEAVGALCQEQGIWLHVDGAMFGSAAVCPEFREQHRGLALADSYCFNPHKWLLTNFDCDCFYVADRAALVGALGISPVYLENRATSSGEVIDYRDWQIPLGRRFRALKLWLVIRRYGIEGLRAHIRRHVALARRFAGWVESSQRFELVAPPSLGLVCFRLRAGDQENEELLHRLNDSGELFLTHTRVGGCFTLRLAVGGTWTEAEHVEAAWRRIEGAGENVASARHE